MIQVFSSDAFINWIDVVQNLVLTIIALLLLVRIHALTCTREQKPRGVCLSQSCSHMICRRLTMGLARISVCRFASSVPFSTSYLSHPHASFPSTICKLKLLVITPACSPVVASHIHAGNKYAYMLPALTPKSSRDCSELSAI